MQTFLIGFLRLRQNNARCGRSGGGLPPPDLTLRRRWFVNVVVNIIVVVIVVVRRIDRRRRGRGIHPYLSRIPFMQFQLIT